MPFHVWEIPVQFNSSKDNLMSICWPEAFYSYHDLEIIALTVFPTPFGPSLFLAKTSLSSIDPIWSSVPDQSLS